MKECEGQWGDKIFNQTDLVVRCIDDAIYMPFSSSIFFDRYPNWGIYTSEGSLVEEASYVRGPRSSLVGQSKHLDLSNIDIRECPFEEMVYGGPIIPHYGHFILTSLARMWAFNSRQPILLHSDPPLFSHGLDFIARLRELARFSPDRVMSFSHPIRIKRLLVPQAALIEQFYVSPSYSLSLVELGNRIERTGGFRGSKCYLSKSKLKRGVARLSEENLIEDAFASKGFDIVYPETLCLPDQVNLFRNASVIAGVASSAFHTLALMADSKATRVIFCFEPEINSNFRLLDFGAGGTSRYFSLHERVSPQADSHFQVSWNSSNTESLASDMAASTLRVI